MMFRSTGVLSTLCVFAFTIQTALAGVATIYLVDQPTPTETDTEVSIVTALATTGVSAVGPGESGRTKYEMEVVQNLLVANIRGTPRTVIGDSEPYTVKYNFEENQSELTLYQLRTGERDDETPSATAFEQGCKLDISKQSGECVNKYVYRREFFTDTAGATTHTRVHTATTTFTGTLFPVATVTTSGERHTINRNILLTAFVGLTSAFLKLL